MMRTLCLSMGIWGLILAGALAQKPDLKPILNQHDLEGWEVPEGNVWWSLSDGVLTAQSDPDQTGSTLWSTRHYQDFVLRLDFRMGEGVIDSGVFLRTENQQVQIGISGSLKRDMTGSLYVPGQGYPLEATGVKDLLKAKDWNTMRIRAKGNTYAVWLNGTKVFTDSSDRAVERGPIGLQLHPKRDMHIEFRDIRLAEL